MSSVQHGNSAEMKDAAEWMVRKPASTGIFAFNRREATVIDKRGVIKNAGRLLTASLVIAGAVGCESVSYVKDEFTGKAKPAGGIAESVSPSRTYGASASTIKRVILTLLEEQGYVTEELANGSIRTEPKPLGDPSKVALLGAIYSVRVLIRVDGSTVTYRSRFDKKSSITMAEQNIEYPEKENELRKAFFAELDKRLSK